MSTVAVAGSAVVRSAVAGSAVSRIGLLIVVTMMLLLLQFTNYDTKMRGWQLKFKKAVEKKKNAGIIFVTVYI